MSKSLEDGFIYPVFPLSPNSHEHIRQKVHVGVTLWLFDISLFLWDPLAGKNIIHFILGFLFMP
jgi:hypothetical protein